MKKFYKVIWVSGIFIILIIILYLVVTYKVKYEEVDMNNYLYFYNCSNDLCTTSTKIDDYYGKYLCEEDCPYVKEIVNENNVILKKINNQEMLYNYQENKIISDDYEQYSSLYIKDSLYGYIVSKEGKVGIIDLNNKEIVKLEYDQIGTYDEEGNILIYNDEFVKVKKDDKWGAISIKDGSIKVNFEYSYNYFKVE